MRGFCFIKLYQLISSYNQSGTPICGTLGGTQPHHTRLMYGFINPIRVLMSTIQLLAPVYHCIHTVTIRVLVSTNSYNTYLNGK